MHLTIETVSGNRLTMPSEAVALMMVKDSDMEQCEHQFCCSMDDVLEKVVAGVLKNAAGRSSDKTRYIVATPDLTMLDEITEAEYNRLRGILSPPIESLIDMVKQLNTAACAPSAKRKKA